MEVKKNTEKVQNPYRYGIKKNNLSGITILKSTKSYIVGYF
jgi:hypothetical protein